MVSWLIEGTMSDGRTFRPSDWVDRISGAVASFGPDHRLRYGLVRPCFVKGKKCLLMRKSLENDNPAAFDFVRSFVRSNGLQMTELASESKEHGLVLGAVA
ncbi:MAG: DUF3579 domain-containing protein [Ectothiorhodospiraceae bacterium]|nr:DUF3579 domain-containing protein [Ectothiorhodospiraceae bacterium]